MIAISLCQIAVEADGSNPLMRHRLRIGGVSTRRIVLVLVLVSGLSMLLYP